MFEFQLFRIKIHPDRQTYFSESAHKLGFVVPESSPEILREVVFGLGENRSAKERVWHIGDILPIEGCFPKNSIKNSRLIDRLLSEKVLEIDSHDPGKIYFNHIIKNETRLKELLKRIQVEDNYLETLLVFWRKTLKESGLHFRLGKTARSSRSSFDGGRFFTEESETHPFTEMVLDIKSEVCAISKNTRLNPHTSGIANRFTKLLNQTKRARILGINFKITPVIDPEDFLEQLGKAYAIKKFWINFSRLDLLKDDRPAHYPLQNYLKELRVTSGKAVFKGANLRAGPLVELARQSASAGHEAGALLQFEKEGPLFSKQLKDNPVVFALANFSDKLQRRDLIHLLRAKYQKITELVD